MKQRNDTDSLVQVAGVSYPIGPGDVIELENLVVGFTAVDGSEPDAEPDRSEGDSVDAEPADTTEPPEPDPETEPTNTDPADVNPVEEN